MKFIVIFISISEIFYVHTTVFEENAKFKCKASEFPFLVLLKTKHPILFCGGALIKQDTVVTASHCAEQFMNSPENIQVLFNVSTDFPNGTDRSNVERIFRHPNSDKGLSFHNITLIVLERPIVRAEPIKLPHNNSGKPNEICERVLTMAYTYQKNIESYNLDPQLNCLNLPIITEDKCPRIEDTNADAFLCRFPEANNFDKSCRDYLGYPVFCQDTLYGIVSNARNCGLSEVLNHRIRVDFVMDFLHEKNGPKKIERFVEKRTRKSSGRQIRSDFFYFFVVHFVLRSGRAC